MTNLKIVLGDLGSGKIYIDTKWDGIDDLCLIDTGASYNNTTHMHFAAYPAIDTFNVSGAALKPITLDVIEVACIQIDSTNLIKTKAGRSIQGTLPESVIGASFFKNKCFEFTFSSAIAQLKFVSSFARLSHPVVSLEKELFATSVQLNDIALLGVWDTGAELSCIDEDFVKRNSTHFAFIQSIENGKDSTGNDVVMNLYRAEQIEIGGSFFQKVDFIGLNFEVLHKYIHPHLTVIVGYNLISKADWKFDLKNFKYEVKVVVESSF